MQRKATAPAPVTARRMWTADQVAAYFGCSVQAVYDAIRTTPPRLPAVPIGSRSWLFDAEVMEQLGRLPRTAAGGSGLSPGALRALVRDELAAALGGLVDGLAGAARDAGGTRAGKEVPREASA